MKHLSNIALIAASLLLSGSALASHKAWVLEHAGGECVYDQSSPETGLNGAGDYGDMFLYNSYIHSRSAECPLIAANRWGSSGPAYVFSPQRWAEAKSAFVHVYEGSPTEAFTCQPVARLRKLVAPGGALYFGTAQSVSGIGNHTLELISAKSWGGSLEANELAQIRSLDFQCSIPPGSAVRGYGVKLCQNLADCGDALPRDDFAGNSTFIQGNGADCSSFGTLTARGADGLTINGDVGGDTRARVACPVLPPAQDSFQHSGRIRKARIYVGGGSPAAGCEINHGCPSCSLSWELRDTGASAGSSTFTWNSAGYLEMPSPGTWLQMGGVPSAVAITCVGLKGQRIRGYTMEMSQTQVSPGQ
jgi:hypothetical protein